MPVIESAGPTTLACRGLLPEIAIGTLSPGAAAILPALIRQMTAGTPKRDNMPGEPAQVSRLRPGRLVHGTRLPALRPA
jgi:hypothetical protein